MKVIIKHKGEIIVKKIADAVKFSKGGGKVMIFHDTSGDRKRFSFISVPADEFDYVEVWADDSLPIR